MAAISPLPVSPMGAAIDPADGALYVINLIGIVPLPFLGRIDLATGAYTDLGPLGPLGSDFAGLAFDPAGQLYALETETDSLWQVDKADPDGPGTAQVGPSLGNGIDLSQGGSLERDLDDDVVYGYARSGGVLFTVDLSTGQGDVLPAAVGLQPPLATIAPDKCSGSITEYGSGCPGSGGFVPHLALSGCPEPNDLVSFSVTNGLGGSTALLLFGLNQAAVPIGGGCSLNVSPVLPVVLVLPLFGSGPGNGSISFDAVLPGDAPAVTVTMQVFVIDAGNPIGGAGTNGVEVVVP
jgi:hypothetical protein